MSVERKRKKSSRNATALQNCNEIFSAVLFNEIFTFSNFCPEKNNMKKQTKKLSHGFCMSKEPVNLS